MDEAQIPRQAALGPPRGGVAKEGWPGAPGGGREGPPPGMRWETGPVQG